MDLGLGESDQVFVPYKEGTCVPVWRRNQMALITTEGLRSLFGALVGNLPREFPLVSVIACDAIQLIQSACRMGNTRSAPGWIYLPGENFFPKTRYMV